MHEERGHPIVGRRVRSYRLFVDSVLMLREGRFSGVTVFGITDPRASGISHRPVTTTVICHMISFGHQRSGTS